MKRRSAIPLDLRHADIALLRRFWSKVDIRGEDDCWEWQAYRKPTGYGQFTLRKGVFITASRASLAMTAPLGPGVHACHHCDNPPCVNPRHLFPGTGRDNALDCSRKGRTNRSRGEDHRSARLTEDQVRYVLSVDVSERGTMARLAAEFGVRHDTIGKIVRRQNWKHIEAAT